MLLLHFVIVFNKKTVEDRIFAEDFLNQNQAAVFRKALQNGFDQGIAVKGPNKLQSQHHQNHRSVVNIQALIEVTTNEFMLVLEAARLQLLGATSQHFLGVINADELNAFWNHLIEVQQGVASGTT